jgi:hypothetical protein
MLGSCLLARDHDVMSVCLRFLSGFFFDDKKSNFDEKNSLKYEKTNGMMILKG